MIMDTLTTVMAQAPTPPLVKRTGKGENDENQIMTIAEIEAQFAAEWVLVEDPQTDAGLAVQSGKVRHHSKDRDEIYRVAVALRAKRFAVLYTGTMPEDTAIIL
jgi:hypothetical protein